MKSQDNIGYYSLTGHFKLEAERIHFAASYLTGDAKEAWTAKCNHLERMLAAMDNPLVQNTLFQNLNCDQFLHWMENKIKDYNADDWCHGSPTAALVPQTTYGPTISPTGVAY
ncbi:uncharacterized protein MEPE_02520 [Melanopsichium pennsylvanicum]|uniref:Uncharacterized protein n=1 Tax=Melanopsichium pennsylvanicum TaxID=63383 RepID=A0AAJ4XK56_9BASI|nr:uncharacterized protein MEPE_02520 [Melanopsichium pennsylvanicum]